ncbi:murein transglycosylase domain-containing protein [Thermodesulfobacteriota bacterium]
MKQLLKILLIFVFMFGCSKGDVVREDRIATTGDVISAQRMATEKVVNYAVNPKALKRDIKRFQKNFAVLIKSFRKTAISTTLLTPDDPRAVDLYAIMKTESDFNPYALSHAPAFGLMQIVPATAGRDVSIYLEKEGLPSDKFLFNPENNIKYGATYLHLLNYKYFKEINNPVSREYCVIAAYNTGAGNVLRTFDRAGSRHQTG